MQVCFFFFLSPLPMDFSLLFFFSFWLFRVFIAACNLVPPSIPHPRVPVNLRFFLHCKVVKNPPANARDTGHVGLIPESGRSPGEGHGNPLQYYCLENSMDRGAWRALLLQSMWLQRVRHDWVCTHRLHCERIWRRSKVKKVELEFI